MGGKLTRTKLRLGIVPSRRFAQSDGVTNWELEALLPPGPDAEPREAGLAGAKERNRQKTRPRKKTR